MPEVKEKAEKKRPRKAIKGNTPCWGLEGKEEKEKEVSINVEVI